MNTQLHADAVLRSYVTAAGLVLTAWVGLAAWSVSPYAEWLDHARMGHIHAPPHVRLAVFALGWALMIAAMMLPSALLLLARRWQNQPLHLGRLAPVILPYLGVWMVFGVLCYVGDGMLHEVVEHSPFLAGMIAPGTLLLAGIYQFTPFKRFCLSRCDASGAGFDQQPRRQSSWTLGLQHGLFCLGSCWALMLLMFAIGGLNLLWMLALGLVMTAERLAHRRAELTHTLGALLILAAIVLA